MDDGRAIADALQGVQSAFEEATRRRVELVRELGRTEVEPGETPARDELVEALLRREVADADTAAPLAERVGRVAEEARRAREARGRLAANDEVGELMERWEATWRDALDQGDRLANVLRPQVEPALADAFAAYVAALRAVHETDESLHPSEIERAVDGLEEAHRRLEAAIGPA